MGGAAVMSNHNPVQAEEADTYTPTAAWELIQTRQSDPAFILLDVRTPEEYAEGHIPDAELLDFKAPDFADKVEGLPKDVTYLVYCRSGARSAKAAAVLREKGFTDVLEIKGGIIEWQKAGLPLIKEE